MIPCRRCAGPATGEMHVLVDDGAVLPGRLRDRRLGPAKKRVPGAALCEACFRHADDEFRACKAEHEALVRGGLSLQDAASAMMRRFELDRLALDVLVLEMAIPATWIQRDPGPEAA